MKKEKVPLKELKETFQELSKCSSDLAEFFQKKTFQSEFENIQQQLANEHGEFDLKKLEAEIANLEKNNGKTFKDKNVCPKEVQKMLQDILKPKNTQDTEKVIVKKEEIVIISFILIENCRT